MGGGPVGAAAGRTAADSASTPQAALDLLIEPPDLAVRLECPTQAGACLIQRLSRRLSD